MEGCVLPLVIEPDPLLHLVSDIVDEVDDSIRLLMADMLATTRHNKGIGLAAIQVGVRKKVIIIDIDHHAEDESQFLHRGKPLYLVNAEVIERSDDTASYREGCLSLPEVFGDVYRPSSVVVSYLNENGERMQLAESNNLLTVGLQHEIDHSNGIVFLDHLSRLKKHMALDKLKKLKARGEQAS